MKHSVTSLILAGAISMASQPLLAEGWELLPVTGDDYEFAPALSVITGNIDPKDGDDGTLTGLELAINCPLLKAPNGVIRQQISYATYDENGAEITTFELNPHYQVEVAPNMNLGFGPGFGYLTADSAGVDDGGLSLQAGASLTYQIDQIVIGAEYRYQIMVSDIEDNAGNAVDLDNSRLMLKLGYRF